MKRFRLFIENFMIYGFGGIISKIIPLIMVPIVTRIMPDPSYFGISDLSNTIVSFGTAFAIMGMYDAMFRMFFERDEPEYKKKVCSTAFVFTAAMSLIVTLMVLLMRNYLAEVFFGTAAYAYIVVISAFSILTGATNGIISAPARMENNRKIFLIMNVASPLLAYSISVPLLIKGYYSAALPFASLASGIIMECSFGIINKKWFSLRFFDRKLLKQMLVLALPLLPNFLIYWVFNSCDRIMISSALGVGESGIYSVSAKIGSISQLIYTAFAGGWQYFAFSTMKEDDQAGLTSRIFECLGVISFAAAIMLCAFCRIIFRMLFTEQYISGYISAAYLFLAPLLLMLFQVIGNQFLVIKKTWPCMLILSSGAVVNVVLNYLLIPLAGIEGAAIATLLGYMASVIVCSIVIMRMGLLVVSKRFVAAAGLFAVYFLLWRLFYSAQTAAGFVLGMAVFFLYGMLYKNEICKILSTARQLKSRG